MVNPASRVSAERLTRSFGGVPAVDGVTLSVGDGEVHGVCGHNGAGKSTVIKMLTGQLAPDAGRILIDGTPVKLHNRRVAQRSGIALVDQELSVVPDLTVLENMLLGDVDVPFVNTRRRSAGVRCRQVLDDIGLDRVRLNQLVATLSIGERQLVEIAKALSQRARILILDEPTATLSSAECERVFAAVRGAAARGCSVIFISHRLAEVLELCDTVTVLRDGKNVATTCTDGLTVHEIIVQMLGEVPQRPAMDRLPDPDMSHALTIEGLHVPSHLENFSLTAKVGRVYAIAGQIGSGASDVLRAVAGLHSRATGAVSLRSRAVPIRDPVRSAEAGIAFVSNDRKTEGLFLGASISTNLLASRLSRLSRFGFLQVRRQRRVAGSLAELIRLPSERLDESVINLSGGNQQKVFVGRCLESEDVYALLLDEPTRGVDVGGRAAIHQLLRNAADGGLVVVFASTEPEELLELGDTIITMYGGQVVGRYDDDADIDEAVLMRDMTEGGGV